MKIRNGCSYTVNVFKKIQKIENLFTRNMSVGGGTW